MLARMVSCQDGISFGASTNFIPKVIQYSKNTFPPQYRQHIHMYHLFGAGLPRFIWLQSYQHKPNRKHYQDRMW